MSDKARLRQDIEEAFGAMEYPGDDRIGAGKDWESAELARVFRGQHWRDWKDKPLELLSKAGQDSVAFLSPEGFRFYLPLYLLAALFHYDEAGFLVDSMVYRLLPPGEMTLKQRQELESNLKNLSGLSEQTQEIFRKHAESMLHPDPSALKEQKARFRDLLDGFSPRQRRAIRAVLESLREEHGDDDEMQLAIAALSDEHGHA